MYKQKESQKSNSSVKHILKQKNNKYACCLRERKGINYYELRTIELESYNHCY